jgi:hypothetical protein
MNLKKPFRIQSTCNLEPKVKKNFNHDLGSDLSSLQFELKVSSLKAKIP